MKKHIKHIQKHFHPHPVVNIGIILMLIGLMVAFYGLIISDPALYAFIIKLKGAGEVLHGVATQTRTSQEAFITASALIVSGAALDVWRRLQQI